LVDRALPRGGLVALSGVEVGMPGTVKATYPRSDV